MEVCPVRQFSCVHIRCAIASRWQSKGRECHTVHLWLFYGLSPSSRRDYKDHVPELRPLPEIWKKLRSRHQPLIVPDCSQEVQRIKPTGLLGVYLRYFPAPLCLHASSSSSSSSSASSSCCTMSTANGEEQDRRCSLPG